MANILFLPVPEFGHMIPPLKLAKALRLRGHQVCYVGLPDFEAYIRSQGLDYLAIFEQLCPRGFLQQRAEKQARLGLDVLSLMLFEAKQAHDPLASDPMTAFLGEIARICQIVRPDLLIVDNMLRDLAGKVRSELAVPTIRLSLHFEEALVGLGTAEDIRSAADLSTIVLCPKEIDFHSSPRKPNYYHLEASIELDRKEPGYFPWHQVDPQRPLIYCSFGSQCHQYEHATMLFRRIIEALNHKPEWQLVMGIGPYLKPQDFLPRPSHILVVNWAPQLQILSRAVMMISHGGLGAVKECIYFAVPMVIFPGKWDQPNHAARVVHHGIGVRGDSRASSVQHILHLIETVRSNPSFKRRIEVMSKTFRDIEDSGIGTRTVEKLMADLKLRQAVPEVDGQDRFERRAPLGV
jgi:UDP:flavonoid glycosyltransferase YjiC (YdhE family)